MNLRQYADTYGPTVMKTLAERAGTHHRYLMLIANRWRRPSVRLARKLVEATDGELGFEELLNVTTRSERQEAGIE